MKKPNVPEPAGLSPAQRRYFYFTASVTGGAIMIVEILGAKMLSPYVGTSHFVWTAQIAVTLIALAFGYYIGGRLVDRSQRISSLYWAILLAAAYLALTVAVQEPVAFACLDLKPFAFGSLMASMALYFVPLALLAMVGPFFVRVLTSNVGDVGGNMGRLTAISTFGSFAGTILIGYVLIPFLPNSWTMYLLSLLLAVISLIHFIVWRGKKDSLAPAILLLLGTTALGYGGVRHDHLRHSQAQEKFYGNSNFGILQVLENSDGTRSYLNDYLWQNTYDPAEKKSTSLFTYMLHGLPQVYVTNVQDVLCIGMGVGIAPMEFARDGAKVDVVEINPAVVPVAEKWFDFEPAKVHLTIGDGRQFLNDCQKKYDAVALDAFLGDSSPSHLMTREAFSAMHRVLKPGGVLVINSFGNFNSGRDFFTTSLYKTLTTVFPSVRIHIAEHPPTGGNTFFVASDRVPLDQVHTPDTNGVHSEVLHRVKQCYAGIIEPGQSAYGLQLHLENGRVLTDDFNPVDFYDARNREENRRSLARYMRPGE